MYNQLIISKNGGYPDSNRELTVPHTVALPIELYPPLEKIQSLCYVPFQSHN